MGHDNPNLSPMRGPSVWAQPQWDGRKQRNADRTLAGGRCAGPRLIAIGVQRRSRATAPLVAIGAGLLALAASPDALSRVRARMEQRRLRQEWSDEVELRIGPVVSGERLAIVDADDGQRHLRGALGRE